MQPQLKLPVLNYLVVNGILLPSILHWTTLGLDVAEIFKNINSALIIQKLFT
jgi:hypothetical protein